MMSDYQIQANAFYADVTSSNEGWGHLIGTQRNLRDSADVFVAESLGGANAEIINI
jgi:hypothetical protein